MTWVIPAKGEELINKMFETQISNKIYNLILLMNSVMVPGFSKLKNTMFDKFECTQELKTENFKLLFFVLLDKRICGLL